MSVNMKQNGALVPVASLTKAISPVGYGDCYSTEEREIGCWLDGKPLYMKTIDFPSIAKGTNTISHNIANIDQPVHVQWYFYFSTNKNILIGHEDSGVGYWAQVYFFTPTSVSYRLGTQWSNIGGLKATFYYTKTTDTVGSGKWTPQGSLSLHYPADSNPIIIGNYGGRPIKRKRIYLSRIVTGSNAISDQLPIIDILIGFHGYCKTAETYPRYMQIGSDINTSGWYCGVLFYGNYQGNPNGHIWCGSPFNNGSAEIWVDYVEPTT